jgi:hypothetical protein
MMSRSQGIRQKFEENIGIPPESVLNNDNVINNLSTYLYAMDPPETIQ